MTVLLYLVPLALFLGLVGLFAFLWSLRNHQYDDLDGAALRILDDNDVETRSAPGQDGSEPPTHLRLRLTH